jgi:hypothetical protein
MDVQATSTLRLGSNVIDSATGIEGVLVALTHWFDRSDEAAILRRGVDRDGEPWPLHWFPASRCHPLGDEQ